MLVIAVFRESKEGIQYSGLSIASLKKELNSSTPTPFYFWLHSIAGVLFGIIFLLPQGLPLSVILVSRNPFQFSFYSCGFLHNFEEIWFLFLASSFDTLFLAQCFIHLQFLVIRSHFSLFSLFTALGLKCQVLMKVLIKMMPSAFIRYLYHPIFHLFITPKAILLFLWCQSLLCFCLL